MLYQKKRRPLDEGRGAPIYPPWRVCTRSSVRDGVRTNFEGRGVPAGYPTKVHRCDALEMKEALGAEPFERGIHFLGHARSEEDEWLVLLLLLVGADALVPDAFEDELADHEVLAGESVLGSSHDPLSLKCGGNMPPPFRVNLPKPAQGVNEARSAIFGNIFLTPCPRKNLARKTNSGLKRRFRS